MHRWDPLLHPLRSALSSSSKPPKSQTTPVESKHVHFADDYTPSLLKLKIVCGPRHDPSLIVYIKLRFESGGGRPRLGFKIRHPREEREEIIEKEARRSFDEDVYGRGVGRRDIGAGGNRDSRHGLGVGGSSERVRGIETEDESRGVSGRSLGDHADPGEWLGSGMRGRGRGKERESGTGRVRDEGRARYRTEEKWPSSGSEKQKDGDERPNAGKQGERDGAAGIEERRRRRY